ncbi:hypothetical protein Tco_0246949 [Tanacetum coccineum]
MLEDFSSNSKGKRTYAYTILFLELKTLNVFNSNSCRDVAVLSAGGTTFGTSFELAVHLIVVVNSCSDTVMVRVICRGGARPELL